MAAQKEKRRPQRWWKLEFSLWKLAGSLLSYGCPEGVWRVLICADARLPSTKTREIEDDQERHMDLFHSYRDYGGEDDEDNSDLQYSGLTSSELG